MARLSLGVLGDSELTGGSTGLEDPLSGARDGGLGWRRRRHPPQTSEGGGTRRTAANAQAGAADPAPLRRFPPSAATAVPEQGGHAPGHPTSQSRHPAADGQRMHTPEVTQHSEQPGERGRLQGTLGFMATPSLEDAVAIGQAERAGQER